MYRVKTGLLFSLLALSLLLSPSLNAQETPLTIVASHSIAADVIARVAGDDAEVVTLIPRGSDPHSFRPTPASLRLLADADLVFVNGANYEEGLLSVIDVAVEHEKLFVISECVPIVPGGHTHEHNGHGHGHGEDDDHGDEDHHEGEDDDHGDEDHHEGEDDDHADEDHHDDEDDDHGDEDHHEDEDDNHGDEDHHEDEDDDHADEHDHEDEDDHHEIAIHEDAEERCAQHEMELGERFLKLQDDEASPGPLYAVDCEALGGCDPHVWLQPRNIAHWTLTVRDILATHDSAHAEGYFERSEAYLQEIEALEQDVLLPLIATLPVELRLLVSHHLSLGYFAGTYGFAELGSVVPGRSTMAEPGVAELAALIDLVRERNLPAIFGETTSSDDLIRQVATETGATLVNLDMESLGEEDGPIGTWIGMMRSNAEAIVNALADEMSG
ncbi:MAG: metal ABC transporter substrate-binding protein [Anaerolineaceae bacterium]|nr:metal ABC transporter substrate-binding protein [Anaerolineaceae bacterium]MCY4024414.1 metal ABC transporter substrate-binding protein [Anaerolineaceae bacterium]